MLCTNFDAFCTMLSLDQVWICLIIFYSLQSLVIRSRVERRTSFPAFLFLHFVVSSIWAADCGFILIGSYGNGMTVFLFGIYLSYHHGHICIRVWADLTVWVFPWQISCQNRRPAFLLLSELFLHIDIVFVVKAPR